MALGWAVENDWTAPQPRVRNISSPGESVGHYLQTVLNIHIDKCL
jgi:hypothetical protein